MSTIFPTDYVRPRTLEEMRAFPYTSSTLLIAGGALLFGQFEPPYERFIDLQALEEFQTIETNPHYLTMGGSVMLSELLASSEVDIALKRALRRTLNPNLCNGASVGETLIARRPLEWLALLAASEAQVDTAGLGGDETNSVENIVNQDLGGRFIAAVAVPRSGLLGSAFVARTPADQPIVCAAVSIWVKKDDNTVSTANAVLGGASAGLLHVQPLDSLIGQPWREVDFTAAAASVREHVSPVGDVFGSADYRREMAAVLTRRALEDARERWIANAAAS